jgi:hypothetical protein
MGQVLNQENKNHPGTLTKLADLVGGMEGWGHGFY